MLISKLNYICLIKKTKCMEAGKKEFQTAEEVSHFAENQDAALIYFYNDNCAPCMSLRPKVIDMVSNSFEKMELGFVNSELYPDIAASYKAFNNPTLIVFFEGNEYKRASKYISIPQLCRDIERPYRMLFE